MRVVVSGGAGFIGRALVNKLASGGVDVQALVRDPAKASFLQGPRVTLVQSDLTDSATMSDAVGGLGIDGKLLVVGASSEPIQVPPFALISGRRSVSGWPSGTASDSEDTLRFSALAGIRPMIETVPLERAAEGYERMMSGKARFRMVITTGN